MTFQKIMEECGAITTPLSNGDEHSKWIIRIELSKEEMMDRNVTMSDIEYAITNSLKNHDYLHKNLLNIMKISTKLILSSCVEVRLNIITVR